MREAAAVNENLALKDHKVVHLYMCFKTGSPVSDVDESLGPETSLALRVLYDYFLAPRRISFSVFVQRIMGPMALSKKSLLLDVVLQAIQQEHGGSKVSFVLSIDEIQALLKAENPKGDERSDL